MGNSDNRDRLGSNKKAEASHAASTMTMAETSVKILQAMAIYLTLTPLIVAIALKEVYYYYGIIFGLAFSGTLVAVNGTLWATKLKKVGPQPWAWLEPAWLEPAMRVF